MSHIVTSKTTISNPNLALLRQAAEVVAGNHQGQVSEHYLNFSHQRRATPLHLAIITPQLERGIGIALDDEKRLMFKGDPWGADTAFQQIQQEIVQTYVALATMQALQEMGYETQAEDAGQGQVAIRGVVYA